MANESTTSTLASMLGIGVREANIILEDRNTNIGGVNLFDYITIDPSKSAMKFPFIPMISGETPAEGSDYTVVEVTSTGPTITPVRKGTSVVITKEMVERGAEQIIANMGKQIGKTIKALQNQAVWALFDGFTQTVGTTNTNITENLILSGKALIDAAGAPSSRVLALTPYVMNDLINIYKTSTSVVAPGIREQINRDGYVSRLFGIDIVQVGNLVAGTGVGEADGADAKCGLFTKETLGAVLSTPVKLGIEWREASQSWLLAGSTYFGVGEIKDTWGVEFLVDNKDA